MRKRYLGLAALLLGLVAVFFWLRSDNSGDPAPKAGKAVETKSGVKLSVRERPRVSPSSKTPGKIAGTVRDSKGASVSGARVCARAWARDLAQEDMHVPACTMTGSDGGYLLSELVPANYMPNVSANGFLPSAYKNQDKEGDDWVKIAEGQGAEGIDLTLHAGGVEVKGIVRDVGGGPVAGASVVGWGGRFQRRPGAARTESDEEGAFTLWLPKGRIGIKAESEGYAPGEAEAIAPGEYVEVLLTPEAVLAGRVVEADSGKPIPRALVGAQPLQEGGWGMRQDAGSAYTDENGNFRITRLAPSRYKAKARIPGGYGEASTSVLLGLGQTVDDVLIEVRPAFVVAGKVLNADDIPCAEGWVTLARDGDQMNAEWAVLEDEGTAEFDAVLPGEYSVGVNCNDSLSEQKYDEVVVIAEDVEGLIWHVKMGANLEGIVTSASGDPVGNANVRVQGVLGEDPRAQMSSAWAQTEDDGSYESKGIAPGRAKLTVQAEGFPKNENNTDLEFIAGKTTTVDVTLDEGGTITGKVVDESSAPIKSVEIRTRNVTVARGGWNMFGGSRSGDDGSFEVKGLAPGSYRVSASGLRAPGKSDDDVGGQLVNVEAGKNVEVTLVVESQNHSLKGTVLDADGSPITDAYVSTARESDAAGAVAGGGRRSVRWSWGKTPVMTDMDGAFEVTGLSEGSYTVRAYRRGGGETLAEGVKTDTSITMKIAGTGSMAGTVVASTVPVLFSITVQDKSAGFSRSERFVGTQGGFKLADLPPGEYECSVSSSAGSANVKVSLAVGEDKTGLKLEVKGLATVTGRIVDLETGNPVVGLRAMVRGPEDMSGFALPMDGDNKNVTDSEGRFTVAKAPTGKVMLLAFPIDRDNSDYQWLNHPVVLESGGEVDLGDLKIAKKRLDKDQRAGDLGFTLKQMPTGTEMADWEIVIALVRPGGPAEDSGLKAGDVITSVDGHDVSEHASLYWSLTQVAAGRSIKFGLERGDTVEITAGPALDGPK